MTIKNVILILVFFISAECFPADFLNYFKDYSYKLYNNDKKLYSTSSFENKWYLITDIYYQLFKYRLGSTIKKDELDDQIDDVIDSIEEGVISNISDKEKELATSLMYGVKCYINSTDTSIGNFKDLRTSYKLSERFYEKYKGFDSAFGYYLTKLIFATYFEDSFWIKDVFGYEGNISESLTNLKNITKEDNFFSIEANLALVEYYTNMLYDHRSSLIFTKQLNENHPESKYFKFLYAKDLYHTGKIEIAYRLYQEINSELTNNYYPFEYSSLIYEIKCLFLLGKENMVADIINYTKQIHDGYLIEVLKKWKSSLTRRKDILYQFEKLNFRDLKGITKNIYDKKNTANVLFDHGYFGELFSLVNMNEDSELLILYMRTSLILREYEVANELFAILETKYEDVLDNHPDLGRILILKNILDNNLK